MFTAAEQLLIRTLLPNLHRAIVVDLRNTTEYLGASRTNTHGSYLEPSTLPRVNRPIQG